MASQFVEKILRNSCLAFIQLNFNFVQRFRCLVDISSAFYARDCVSFDDGLAISTTEVEEIVDLLEPMNSDSDAKFDNETLTETVTFANAL
ncbi:hypothetical protein TNCV_2926981 [Trichonephila clavipes]|nr:hypothetical protein TNCV_2926981 [Trichonephila clavipes]